MYKVILFLFFSIRLYAYEFEVSIATIFRDEAHGLKEWIEFHKLIGVEHFYLYNNCSQDNFQEVLRPYVEEGIVDLIEWSVEHTSRNHFISIQRNALRDAISRAQGKSKWVAFIDADEYIFLVKDQTLSKFLSNYEEYGAVTINWQMFGTSHIEHLRKDRLMIEQLIFRADVNFSHNSWVKPIVQVDYIDLTNTNHWPHFFHLIDKRLTVNANKEVVEHPIAHSILIDKIRIHHYALGDEYHFHEVKLKQIRSTNSDKKRTLEKIHKHSNEIEDRSILIYAEELRKAVFE